MNAIKFTKVESVGNDFVLVHVSDLEAVIRLGSSTTDEKLSQLATQVCRRRYGVGADGLLVVERLGGGIGMRMFNPDGTEDFCGNGMRCAAAHAHRLGWVSGKFQIHHGGQQVEALVEANGCVQTTFAGASYDPARVPHSGTREIFDEVVWKDGSQSIRGSALTTGSTHLVLQASSLPDDAEFFALGTELEHDARFPERTSVIWAVEAAPGRLAIRIWERGAGETLGCGTGASAAVADYFRRRGKAGRAQVTSRGGDLFVSAETWNAPLCVIGSAVELFSGEYLIEQDSG